MSVLDRGREWGEPPFRLPLVRVLAPNGLVPVAGP